MCHLHYQGAHYRYLKPNGDRHNVVFVDEPVYDPKGKSRRGGSAASIKTRSSVRRMLLDTQDSCSIKTTATMRKRLLAEIENATLSARGHVQGQGVPCKSQTAPKNYMRYWQCPACGWAVSDLNGSKDENYCAKMKHQHISRCHPSRKEEMCIKKPIVPIVPVDGNNKKHWKCKYCNL